MMKEGNGMNERELETLIERLVDGELSGESYRRLLASLDDEPAGWRRCALAFLEAQALGQELPMVRRTLETADVDRKPASLERLPAPARSEISWLAIAASFLAAFSLGLIAPRFFSRQTQDDFASGNLHSPAESLPSVTPVNFDPRNLRNIGNLQLVADDGAPGEARQVPVYESEQNLNDALTGSFQGALPPMGPDLIDLLRGHGYDVRHEQQYVPATLEDGRQMVVPLEGYQITPVSRRY
jgi:hypothetical protein